MLCTVDRQRETEPLRTLTSHPCTVLVRTVYIYFRNYGLMFALHFFYLFIFK